MPYVVGEDGAMRPSEALTIHRFALRELLNRHGFPHAHVFGSVLTKTDTEDSDLDLLVEPRHDTTLFTLVSLETAVAGRTCVGDYARIPVTEIPG